MNKENRVFLKNLHFSKYILLTLARADANELRASIDIAEIVERRSAKIHDCITIAVAREQHQQEGNHLNIGLLLERGLFGKGAPRLFI